MLPKLYTKLESDMEENRSEYFKVNINIKFEGYGYSVLKPSYNIVIIWFIKRNTYSGKSLELPK